MESQDIIIERTRRWRAKYMQTAEELFEARKDKGFWRRATMFHCVINIVFVIYFFWG